jgi:hypothetical protein
MSVHLTVIRDFVYYILISDDSYIRVFTDIRVHPDPSLLALAPQLESAGMRGALRHHSYSGRFSLALSLSPPLALTPAAAQPASLPRQLASVTPPDPRSPDPKTIILSTFAKPVSHVASEGCGRPARSVCPSLICSVPGHGCLPDARELTRCKRTVNAIACHILLGPLIMMIRCYFGVCGEPDQRLRTVQRSVFVVLLCLRPKSPNSDLTQRLKVPTFRLQMAPRP